MRSTDIMWRMEKTIEAFFFDPDYLSDIAARTRRAITTAKPFPHVVIDDFLPEAVAQRILDEFPSPGADDWYRWQLETEQKLQTTAELGIGPFARQVLNQFNSSAVIDFLEALTGIEHLVPDPHYLGGGLHQIERGGFLKVHADFNHHSRLDLQRRLNLLLYLNRDWRDEWGGHLELWDTRHDRGGGPHRADLQSVRGLQHDKFRLPRSPRSASVPGGSHAQVDGALLLHEGSTARRTHAELIRRGSSSRPGEALNTSQAD